MAKTSESQWLEIPVFIHGISPDPYPNSGSVKEEYEQLLELVENFSENKCFDLDPIRVVWGIENAQTKNRVNQYLAQAERNLQEKIRQEMGRDYDALYIAKFVRNFLLFGISDLFYYVSADGEKDLREQIFSEIAKRVRNAASKDKKRVSLTIFGHSAGSVIAHDLLFHLFRRKGKKRKPDKTDKVSRVEEDIESLRDLIKKKRLRIRRFYTFGSPISLLALRAKSLIYKIRDEETLKPNDIGLQDDDSLNNPRWVNFWNKYDLASAPVEFLYDNEKGVIEDREIRASVNPATAHTGYWTSVEMAKYIAQKF